MQLPFLSESKATDNQWKRYSQGLQERLARGTSCGSKAANHTYASIVPCGQTSVLVGGAVGHRDLGNMCCALLTGPMAMTLGYQLLDLGGIN